MDFNKINLFINTIIHLKPIQLYYRLFYFLRNRFPKNNGVKSATNDFSPIVWKNGFYYENSYFEKNSSFTFLNSSHSFRDKINWNFSRLGKLWTYNLNYFDFLNQENISRSTGISLIRNFVVNESLLLDGRESYTISLRGINWVKFLSEHEVNEDLINDCLYNHYCVLTKNLEYHLLGNHLLENAFSLLFGAYYFQDEKLFLKSKGLLLVQLKEQILDDGAHFELSTMYHQIVLSRLLDSINLIRQNDFQKNDELLFFLEKKASVMISWLENVTYLNGNIPMVNDSTYNIAPSSKELFAYGKLLGIVNQRNPLSDSGYRKVNVTDYELFMDVGNIGPSYQPGHAHSDSFNFELIKRGNAIIVDTGISTYEKNSIRQKERSTSSHNTVKIGSREQSQVWGGFRVAKRAKVHGLIEKTNYIAASHDGYIGIGLIHKRSFLWEESQVTIIDEINSQTGNEAKAFFHLHSSVGKPLIDENTVILESSKSLIAFENANRIYIDEYQLSEGFNKSKLAYKIVVVFDQSLKTKISP